MPALPSRIFDLLDKYRHFPNWQLERRADIFFSLYLEKILQTRGITNIQGIIPEFPVRLGEIPNHPNINRSYKIDYVVIYQNTRTALVELKTDNASRREEQDQYLLGSQEIGFQKLLEGLLKIYAATDAKKKYRAMLDELVNADVLNKTNNKNYEIIQKEYETPEIYYIQPNGDGDNTINFHQIADILDSTDEFEARFAQSLRLWADKKAGDTSV